MKQCLKCGKENDDDKQACEYCSAGVFKHIVTATAHVEDDTADSLPIGGWLILVAVGLIISPILSLIGIISLSDLLFANNAAGTLSQAGTEIDPLMQKPMGTIFLGYFILSFIIDIVLLYLFFTKKRAFPKVMIVVLLVSLLYPFAEYALYSYFSVMDEEAHTQLGKDIIRALIYCAIWIPYFLKSERVKQTFVN